MLLAAQAKVGIGRHTALAHLKLETSGEPMVAHTKAATPASRGGRSFIRAQDLEPEDGRQAERNPVGYREVEAEDAYAGGPTVEARVAALNGKSLGDVVVGADAHLL